MLEGDVFALRGGHDPICVSVGLYDVTTCLQHGDGDKVSNTFLFETHLEVTICSLRFGGRSAGFTSAGHCGVALINIRQELF